MWSGCWSWGCTGDLEICRVIFTGQCDSEFYEAVMQNKQPKCENRRQKRMTWASHCESGFPDHRRTMSQSVLNGFQRSALLWHSGRRKITSVGQTGILWIHLFFFFFVRRFHLLTACSALHQSLKPSWWEAAALCVVVVVFVFSHPSFTRLHCFSFSHFLAILSFTCTLPLEFCVRKGAQRNALSALDLTCQVVCRVFIFIFFPPSLYLLWW